MELDSHTGRRLYFEPARVKTQRPCRLPKKAKRFARRGSRGERTQIATVSGKPSPRSVRRVAGLRKRQSERAERKAARDAKAKERAAKKTEAKEPKAQKAAKVCNAA